MEDKTKQRKKEMVNRNLIIKIKNRNYKKAKLDELDTIKKIIKLNYIQ
jgi:hypothetical protein